MYDRRRIGLVLIGMPGLQKRLARYSQLYSRVGFVHQFLPLGGAELRIVIRVQSQQLGLGLELYDGDDASILSSIVRITGGNFRLVERLFAQLVAWTEFHWQQLQLCCRRVRFRSVP
jgi:hypothetical protein